MRKILSERQPLDNTGLPAGVNIWLDYSGNDKLDKQTVRVGRYYETALSVIIDDHNPMPVEASERISSR